MRRFGSLSRLSSRERVLTTFAHEEPDRVPLWIGSSPEFWAKLKAHTGIDDEGLRKRLGGDFRRVFARYAGPEQKLSEGATYRSVFGVERHGYGQPLTPPPLATATVQEIHDYPWPGPAWMDVSHIREEARAWGGEYAVLGGDWSPFWHDAIDLVGMEIMMPGGGFVVGPSHGYVLEETPAENVLALCDAVREFGGYAR